MTDEQRARMDSLRQIIALWPNWESAPSSLDIIAMAEWVSEGSISAATAAEGHRHGLYRDHVHGEDE